MKVTAFPRFAALAVGMAAVLVAGCGKESSSDAYAARIGQSVLTEQALMAQIPEVIAHDSAAVIRKTIESWAERELLYQQALKEGLLNDPRLQAHQDEYRKALYGQTFLDMYLARKVVVSTDEVREYYTRNRDQFRRKKPEVILIHFVLESEREALEVRRKLGRMEGSVRQELLNFYNVQAQIVSRGTLIPSLDRAVFGSSGPPRILGPIRSDFGYHILEVLEFYPHDSFRGLDQVYDDISQHLFQMKSAARYERLIDSLMAISPLKIHPNFAAPKP